MPNEGGTAPGSQCPRVHEVWQQASITVSLDIEVGSGQEHVRNAIPIDVTCRAWDINASMSVTIYVQRSCI